MIPLLGFSPDLERTTPGVITDCTNFVPYRNGMQAGPSNSTPADVPALAAECIGTSIVTIRSGSRRVFAGTTTKLYELSSGSWADVTRASGGNYTGGSDTRWAFTQFGNATIAVNKTDAMQRSSTSGAFADVSGAPKAEIVFSVGAFVMALNTNDGTDKPDGWHNCATFDETSWTPSVTTQAASGQLVDTSGIITAGARLGDYAIAYKLKSIYLGQYIGGTTVWDWRLVPGGEAGCVGKEAICDIGGVHFFVGDDNIWMFDGSRPIPAADDTVRQWFFDNVNASFKSKIKCVFDRQNNRVWIFYPSSSSTTCNSALVYHVVTKQWGKADRSIEAAVQYVSSGATYDTWSSFGASYDALPDISYDSQYWLSGGSALSVFNTSHQLQLLTGAAGASSFTTGDAGDDDGRSLLTQLRLRFPETFSPTTASATFYHKDSSGDSPSTGETVFIADNKFDTMQEAYWHSVSINFTGNVKVTHIRPIIKPAGER